MSGAYDSNIKRRSPIIEVNPNQPASHHAGGKKKHRHHHQSPSRAPASETHKSSQEDGDEPPLHIPLELLPVVKTLMGYGKRINALGALRGAYALEKLIKVATPVSLTHPELVDALFEAKAEAEAIRRGALQEMAAEDPE